MSLDQPPINFDDLDQWFPIEQQNRYVSLLFDLSKRPVGLTRKQATYLVRLWGYLFLQDQHQLGKKITPPLTELSLPEGYIPCSHREAAEIFYYDQEKGSERSAGMMIDRLADLGFINKQFDGNITRLQINNVSQFNATPEKIQLQCDQFNLDDATPVANFLAYNYRWNNSDISDTTFHIKQVLQQWAEQYPQGMRVLRRCDNKNPVGFYIFYPTAQESERKFFAPPSEVLYLASEQTLDPIQIAQPGDPKCNAVFIRSWMINHPYIQNSYICQFLKDSQQTVREMQKDFPNLYDLYALAIHPSIRKFEVALGFQKTYQDTHSGIYWMYKSIKHFLDLDMEAAISSVDF